MQSSSLTPSTEMLDGGKKILHDAPEAQTALLENHSSLLQVSEYCYQNYIQSGNRSALALEETKKLTSQSLASVAYQINSLAGSVLSLLDAQAHQLLRLESSINLIGQAVEMHREKVARREIGGFTVVQRVTRAHKILPPAPQPPQTYSRCPINYQLLDHLGHGAKISGRPAKQPGTIRTLGSTLRSSRTSEIPLHGSLASSEPPEPPAGSSFRIGKQVEPPTVPQLTSPSGTLCGSAPGSAPSHPLESPGGAEALPPPPDLPVDAEVLPSPPDPPAEVEVLPPPPDPPAEVEVLPPPLDPPTVVEVLPPPPDPPAEVEVLPPPPDPPTVAEVLPPPPDPPAGVEAPPPEPDSSLIVDPHPQNAEAPPPPSDLPVAVQASPHLPDTPEVAEVPPPSPECLEAASPGAGKVATVPSSTTRGRPPRRTALSTLSLRVPSGSARHRCQTRSLFLPSLIIPPPPPYPAPSVPSEPPPPPPRFCLPARLDHLDLEILTPPPCLLLDNEGGCNDRILPPSDQPAQPSH
ncbi:uncharacterized protein ACB057_016502 [Neosynchiropus ocellatus]